MFKKVTHFFLLSGLLFSFTFAQKRPVFETLPPFVKENPNNPETDYTIERFRINDPKSTECIEVVITKKCKCGFQRYSGIQIESTRNSLKQMYAFCQDVTSYWVQKMNSETKREMVIDEASSISTDGKSYCRCTIVLDPSPHLLIEAKTANTDVITKTFEMSYPFIPYENTSPTVEMIDRKLLAANEIEQFKITDLSQKEEYRVRVVRDGCGMKKEPCLQISVAHNNICNKDDYAYLTRSEINRLLKNAKNGEALAMQKQFPNKGWGLGKQLVQILVTESKAKLIIYTKTSQNPLVKEYDLGI
jgi:hypothetical protein